ncbi:MAG: hypothetical protein MJZ34_07555 [Paludibacteraceae bacterium]|nr:hypothetical protein [Paludibacteraceae bacterium]
MIGGILDPHSLENFIAPIGYDNKTPIEKAVHALLVRELYRDGKKVFLKKQMPEDEVVDYSYHREIERKTCELLDLDYEKTLVKLVANDLWSFFQWQKSVTILDWKVSINGDVVNYSIMCLKEE